MKYFSGADVTKHFSVYENFLLGHFSTLGKYLFRVCNRELNNRVIASFLLALNKYLLKPKTRLLTSRTKLNLPLETNIQIQMFGLTL